MPDNINQIDRDFNYNNIFFRMVNIGLAKTLNKRLRWINYFKDEKKCVSVPFYLSMAGSERFLLDSFVDDITDQRVETNTDQIPRGVITMTSMSTDDGQFANPNIYIEKKVKIHDKLSSVVSKVRAIPIILNYEVELRVDSEIDIYKLSEKILDMFFNYRFFNIDYFGLKIDCVFELPPDKQITLPRDSGIDMSSDNVKSITFSTNVHTYYPSWMVDTDEVNCENVEYENIKRVYWKYYIHDLDKLGDELPEDPNQRQIENFNEYDDFTTNNPSYDKFFDITKTGITWG